MQWRFFTEFCDTTGIGSFKYISATVSRWERIFWLLTVFTGVSFTFFFCYSTLTHFYEETTATSLTIERNSSLKLKPPILCVEVDRQAMLIGVNVTTLNITEIEFFLEEILNIGVETNFLSESEYFGLALISNVIMNLVKLESYINTLYKGMEPWEVIVYKYIREYDLGLIIKKIGTILSRLISVRIERSFNDRKRRRLLDIHYPISESDITWLGIAPFQE